ncbi:MAG TPA: DUF4097 family beta strand repeat-containing protein [Vicinamibacterales bacterium]|nr:DUF4097 family beta strand repeat-containing protein [Vicinamibacterales bacterium]
MKLFAQLSLLTVCAMTATSCGEGIDLAAFEPTRVKGQFERTLSVNGPVDLSVRTGSGDIHVKVGADNQVRVVGRITSGNQLFGDGAQERVRQVEAAPPIQQAGNVIRIGDTNDDQRYRNISISYELIVPANTQMTSHTGSGDQVIGSLNGSVSARAGSGDIDVERAGGGLDARAGSGDVHAKAVGGAINVRVGSGDVDVAQTGKGDVDIQAGSGDVTVVLPTDAAVTLTARTGSGSIDTHHPVQVQGKRQRNRLEGPVRGGGSRVDIKTGSGSIEIR